MKTVGLVILLLLLGVPAVASQIPDDTLIVPGKRIGRWALTMTIDDLERLRGPASHTLLPAGRNPNMDLVRDTVLFRWGNLPIGAVTFDGQKRIEVLQAGWQTAIRYKTDRSIGFAATAAEVRRTYGRPTAETSPRPGQIRLIYDRIGIFFRFDAGQRLSTISIFRPGGAKSLYKF